jgi:transposase InsO family protein
MRRGFLSLFAILDWASRRVLAWRLSNTLTTDFCVDAVQEAISQYGRHSAKSCLAGLQNRRSQFKSRPRTITVYPFLISNLQVTQAQTLGHYWYRIRNHKLRVGSDGQNLFIAHVEILGAWITAPVY